MNFDKCKRVVFSLAAGGLLLVGLLWLLGGTSPIARANPGPLFVGTAGTGTVCSQVQPCALQTALSQAVGGDAIYMGVGSYTGAGAAVITVTKSITLYGGWDGTTTTPPVRDPVAYPTVLEGEGARRVVYIAGTVVPLLQGLTLQNGDASGLGGDPWFDVGGAVYANNASPVITDCRILSSSAQFGGGVAFYYGAPTLGNSVVLTNTASRGGGGLFLYHSPATIVGNTVVTNTATGTNLYDGGGGIYLDNSAATILGNAVLDNHGAFRGGGLFLYESSAALHGNTIQENRVYGEGGGAFLLMSAADFDANMIVSNAATNYGGGLIVVGSAPFTLTNNFFAWNITQGGPAALFVSGCIPPGCPTSIASQGTSLHNTFVENHSMAPWMIGVGTGSGPAATVAFTNTIIGMPGGIWVDSVGSVMVDTTLWHIGLQGSGLTVGGPGTIISSTHLYDVVPPEPHLYPGSAAIDAGANAGVTTDIDGDPRPNDLGYDIGADEFYCFAPAGVTIPGPPTGITGTVYTFTATVSPPTTTLPITFRWRATGRTPITHTVHSLSDTVDFSWPIAGTQTITVTATNCGGGKVDTHTFTIPAQPLQPAIYLPLVVKNH